MNPGISTKKKIMYAAIAVVAVLYLYFSQMIGPLLTERTGLAQKIDDAEKRIKERERTVILLRNQIADEKAKANQDGLAERLLSTLPTKPIVECHGLLTQIANTTVAERVSPRLRYMFPVKSMRSRLLYGWEMSVQNAKCTKIGELIADVEQRLPLAQVMRLELTPGTGNGQVEAAIEICIAANQ